MFSCHVPLVLLSLEQFSRSLLSCNIDTWGCPWFWSHLIVSHDWIHSKHLRQEYYTGDAEGTGFSCSKYHIDVWQRSDQCCTFTSWTHLNVQPLSQNTEMTSLPEPRPALGVLSSQISSACSWPSHRGDHSAGSPGFAFFHATSFCEIQVCCCVDLCFTVFMITDLLFSWEWRVGQDTCV